MNENRKGELYEMRLRQLELLTRSMLESQQQTVQILIDHSCRLEQMQDDLNFIKEILCGVSTRLSPEIVDRQRCQTTPAA